MKHIVDVETNFSNEKCTYERKKLQARNQEFFRTRDITWNGGTSVNTLLTTHQREVPQEKI